MRPQLGKMKMVDKTAPVVAPQDGKRPDTYRQKKNFEY